MSRLILLYHAALFNKFKLKITYSETVKSNYTYFYNKFIIIGLTSTNNNKFYFCITPRTDE